MISLPEIKENLVIINAEESKEETLKKVHNAINFLF